VRCRLSPEITARSVEGIDVEVRARVTRLDREGLRIAAAEALAISREVLGLSAGVRTDLRVSLLRTARS
jgi:hypothetical protein